MDVNEDTIIEWEKTGKISYQDLTELAEYYQRPPATFFNVNKPVYSNFIPDLRTVQSQKKYKISPEFSFEIRNAKLRREKLIELEEDSDDFSIPFFKLENVERGSKVSEIIIDKLQINHGKRSAMNLDYWINEVEKLGVLVFQFYKIDPKEVRGYALYYDKLPIIGINNRDSDNGKKFTLFHELAHLVLKKDGFSNFDTYFTRNVEKKCNHIAAEILVPSEILKKKFENKNTPNWDFKIKSLAKNFKVSEEVIVRRLLDLNIVSKQFYQDKKKKWDKFLLINQNEQKKYSTKEKPKKSREKPKKGSKLDHSKHYKSQATTALKRNGLFYTKSFLDAFDNDIISIDDLTEDLDESLEVITEIRGKIHTEVSD